MKLSYTYATPETRSIEMLAYRGEMESVFQKLSTLGYEGIELMVRDARELNSGQINQICKNTNLKICSVSTGQLRAEDGLNLSDLDQENRKNSIERTRAVIELASALEVQVNIGTLRGRLPEKNPEEAKKAMADSLHELLPFAADLKVNIALEPQNRFTINWLNSVPETLDWIRQFRADNLKLVFDVYHWLLEEQSIAASLIRSWDRISHVQFSDSNRGIPGTAQLNFPELIHVLKALNYQGYISIEARQYPDSYTVAKSSAGFLLPLIKNDD